MKHRSDYRIVKVHKEGYYSHYRVEQRFWWFFWVEDAIAYDTIEEAQSWIQRQTAVVQREVVW